MDSLIAEGYHTIYKPEITWKEALTCISEYHGIVINTKMKMNEEMLAAGKNLRFIARLGSGLDIINLDICNKRKIEVISAPEGNMNAVAEHALGMLLMMTNKLKSADLSIRNGKWEREKHRGTELEGKTLGIIGYGNNGSRFARILSRFGMKILVYDKYKKGFSEEDEFVEEVDFKTILAKSDIISLHVPLTEETYHMINQEALGKCRQNCILINTSRGSVVNLSSLVKALELNRIKGACLDVLENEKPVTFSRDERILYQRLWKLDNVILSPHVAGWTFESKFKIARTLVDKIKKWNLKMS